MGKKNKKEKLKKKKKVGSTIPELNKEREYPAQGAYVGFLLTDILSTRMGMKIVEVDFSDGCLTYEMALLLHDEDGEVVDYETFHVTFHRGTISLACPSEDWWPRVEQSAIFNNLYDIAAYTGCLVAISALDTNTASVRDPQIDMLLAEKEAFVHEAPPTIN